jgi:hypothetical protein
MSSQELKNPVDKFISIFSSNNTKRNYSNGLFDFFSSVYGNPSFEDAEEKRQWTKEKAVEYLAEKHDYESDVNGFVSSTSKLAPKSVRLKLTAAKMFLLENGIELSQLFWRRVNKRSIDRLSDIGIIFDRSIKKVQTRNQIYLVLVRGEGESRWNCSGLP